jgi:hypothetical protein
MAFWKVSTTHKKSCEEHMIWTKDNRSFKIINGYRWGTFTIETEDDNSPEGIDPENPDGIEMYCYSGSNVINGAELDSMDDGWYMDFEFDEDEFTEEEQEQLRELWDEDSYEGLEGAGWINDETEAWLFGPLEITREDVEPSADEWTKADNLPELQELFDKDMTDDPPKTKSLPEWPFPTGDKDDKSS